MYTVIIGGKTTCTCTVYTYMYTMLHGDMSILYSHHNQWLYNLAKQTGLRTLELGQAERTLLLVVLGVDVTGS